MATERADGVDSLVVPTLIRFSGRGIAYSRAEVMERFEDVGMTSEQTRNQYSKQENDESQNENESHHCVSFASGERRELYRPRSRDQGHFSRPSHPTAGYRVDRN